MSKNWVIRIIFLCFVMVNKNKLFHQIHNEFTKGKCFKLFDYADGFVFLYLYFCTLLLKNSEYFHADWLGSGLQLQ